MKTGRASMLAAVALLASACYHQVVQTGMAPGTRTVDKPWTATWVFGLVPASPIDVTQDCPAGIATVSTQMTVPNWLASFVTLGLYDPRQVTVTCAQAGASLGTPAVEVSRTASPSERAAAFERAAELSSSMHGPVVIRF